VHVYGAMHHSNPLHSNLLHSTPQEICIPDARLIRHSGFDHLLFFMNYFPSAVSRYSIVSAHAPRTPGVYISLHFALFLIHWYLCSFVTFFATAALPLTETFPPLQSL